MILKHRKEIDGLRAIAVIPVVFFHAGFNLFSGGYVGVDVFFVISGYLITSIIIKELNNNTFSLTNFYERRARRILPVLIFVIFISSIISFIFLTRSELAEYFQSVKATLLFYSNFYFWKTSPYFISESELKPLLHTWSLSIEEQFYIIFPIILFCFYKFYKKFIPLLLVFGFLTGLLLCQIMAVKTGGTLNFYFTLSRAWELALGALSAYYLMIRNIQLSKKTKDFLSILGFILILYSVFFFDKQTLYPSLKTLLPTIGTVLIIMYADEKTLINKILSIRFFVLIGLISYSFYLWHQPFLAFGRIYFQEFTNFHRFFLITISFLLSFFSYNFIEKIFRDKKKIKFRFFLKTIFSSIIFLILFSQINLVFFSTKNSTEALLAKILTEKDAIYATKMDERKFIKNRIINENLDPEILIVGSSRIMQISNENFNKQILNLSVSGASIEDHIAIVSMSIEKFKPKKILLGADPWLFNNFNNQSRWKSISTEYDLSLENIKLMKRKNKILTKKENFNNYSFYEKYLDNLYSFLNIRNLSLDLTNKEIKDITKDIILRDGKRVYAKEDNKEKIKPHIIDYSMKRYEFSDEYYKIYKDFLRYLVHVHNKDVILVLSPYHSKSYEKTIQNKPFYLELEDRFRKITKEINIKVIGSYDSKLTNCKDEEFRDGMHPNDKCMKKISDKIF